MVASFKTRALPNDRTQAQQWVYLAGGRSQYDEVAFAQAVLLASCSQRWDYQHMLILKGSRVRATNHGCRRNVCLIRERLAATGKWGDLRDTFVEDVIFSSPSLAACVIDGGSRTGWDGWRLCPDGFWNETAPTLSKAYSLAKEGRLEMIYYSVPLDLKLFEAG